MSAPYLALDRSGRAQPSLPRRCCHLSNAALNFIVFALIIALAAQGWNLLGGFAGQSSFGHAAFFGTGAYVTALLQLRFGVNAWAALAAGIALGALVGWVIGVLSFRAGLRGSYFALVTLAFAEVLRILANAMRLYRRRGGPADQARSRLRQSAVLQPRAVPLARAWVCRAGTGDFAAHRRHPLRRPAGGRARERGCGEGARRRCAQGEAARHRPVGRDHGGSGRALRCSISSTSTRSIAYGAWISVEALLAPIVGGRGTVLGPIIGAFTLHGLGEATKAFAGARPGHRPGGLSAACWSSSSPSRPAVSWACSASSGRNPAARGRPRNARCPGRHHALRRPRRRRRRLASPSPRARSSG